MTDYHLEWHPYKIRVRDMIISLSIFYLYIHLLSHWNSYNCLFSGNIILAVLLTFYIGRFVAMHFRIGYQKMISLVSYILFTAGILSISILFTVQFSNNWDDMREDDTCKQTATFVILCGLGYYFALRSAYVILAHTVGRKIEPQSEKL